MSSKLESVKLDSKCVDLVRRHKKLTGVTVSAFIEGAIKLRLQLDDSPVVKSKKK